MDKFIESFPFIIVAVISLTIGVYIGMTYMNHQYDKAYKLYKQEIENMFYTISVSINNGNSIFLKRINQTVFIDCGDCVVVLYMDKSKLAIFQGEDCKAV